MLRATALVFSIAIVGCSGDPADPCEGVKCGPGLVCFAGECRVPCNRTADRPLDQVCGGGICVVDNTGGDRASGDTVGGDTHLGDTRNGDTRTGDTRNGDTRNGDTRNGDTRTGDTGGGDVINGDLNGGDAGSPGDSGPGAGDVNSAGDFSSMSACNDSVISGGEQCDDGPTMTGGADGCDVNCQVEPGWGCSFEPSQCVRVVYVNRAATGANDGTSWTDAFVELSTALSAAVDGDEIWIASGRYLPGGNRSATFTFPAGLLLTLRGGFQGNELRGEDRLPNVNVAVLSGDILGNDVGAMNIIDNAYHVVSLELGAAAVIEGVTVEAGNSTGAMQAYGSAIRSDGNLNLRDSVINRNFGLLGAVGSHSGFAGSMFLRNVTFTNNGGSGVSHEGGAVGGLFCDACDFVSNIGFGIEVPCPPMMLGGITTVRIRHTTFSGAGGIHACQTDLAMSNVQFMNNNGTPMSLSSGAAFVTNALFVNPTGDAIRISPESMAFGDLFLTNATVLGSMGFGINVTTPSPMSTVNLGVTNTIFAGNAMGDITGAGPGMFVEVTTFSITTRPGMGNLNVNPMLDSSHRPLMGSPAIDAGDNGAPNLMMDTLDVDDDMDTGEPLPWDLAGNPRIQDDPAAPDTGVGMPPFVDMGAFER